MFRIALIAAALALPVGEALARQHEPAVPGALAGRSPHHGYRPIAPSPIAPSTARIACAGTSAGPSAGPSAGMIAGPTAGRLATSAAPRPGPGCTAVRTAEVDGPRSTGRD